MVHSDETSATLRMIVPRKLVLPKFEAVDLLDCCYIIYMYARL
eukprot:COSAG05_NODE_7364_length_822_cov_0.780083_1_plen_42_part_10